MVVIGGRGEVLVEDNVGVREDLLQVDSWVLGGVSRVSHSEGHCVTGEGSKEGALIRLVVIEEGPCLLDKDYRIVLMKKHLCLDTFFLPYWQHSSGGL